jgi:hypothetical protein
MVRTFFAALIPGLLSLATAGAQTPNVVTREATITAKVERIEKSSRVVTLRGE